MLKLPRTLFMLVLVTIFHQALQSTRSEKTPGKTSRNRRSKLIRPADGLCSPKTVYVEWSTIKNQLREIKTLKDAIDDDDVLLHSKAQGGPIPIKWCQSTFTPCRKPDTKCAYGTMKRKRTVVALAVKDNVTKLVSLDYMEAENCLCKDSQSVVDIFPVIVQAKVAEYCIEPTGQIDVVIADLHWSATLSFRYFSPAEGDVPKSVMIHRADGFSHPLELHFLRRIGNSHSLTDPSDWRSRAEMDVGNGLVELLLQNITYTDGDTYFCSVEFLNSSSCFMAIELRVLDAPQEAIQDTCELRAVHLDWATVRQQLIEDPNLDPFIMKVNMRVTFELQRCLSSLSPCHDPNKSCVSATTQRKRVFACVPDENEERKTKIVFDYMEDEMCSCGLKESSLADSEAELHRINITRVERVGTCNSNKCKPKNTYVSWENLRERLDKWTYLKIPPHVLGPDLRVKKCRQELSKCDQPGRFCDVAAEKRVQKTMRLKNVNMTITLKVVEARRCKCKERRDLTYDVGINLHGSPVVTHVVVKDTDGKKIVEF